MTTSTTALPTVFWQLLVDGMLEVRFGIDDHHMSTGELRRLEGRVEALCEQVERTLGLPVGNVLALIGLNDRASCVRCGGSGRIDREGLTWMHRDGGPHSFDLVGELGPDSPLLRVLSVALLDSDDLWEAWECGFRW